MSEQHSGGPKKRKTARDVALEVLVQVEKEHSYSNLQLNQALQGANLPRVDAGLATELVYGTIQRLNTIDGVLEQKVQRGLSKLKPWMRNLLRMTAYQLHYLDRIPAHAAINEAVTIAKRRGGQSMGGFANGVLRAIMREPNLWDTPAGSDPVSRIVWEHSHPAWLVSNWIDAYGEADTAAMCEANNRPPHGSVRVNALRTNREKLLADMQEEGLHALPSSLSKDGIVAEGAGNLALSKWYRNGELSVQDESSMLVVEALRPEAGMRVLDCCAAPGGKTTHIAERMGNTGEVVANDVHAHKVALIADQAERLGLTSVATLNVDASTLGRELPAGSFDAVLLDAPCTGFGVIRRKPDIKWAKRPEDVSSIASLQAELLDQAAQLVRPGGRLVYSTCTVERTENEDVVRRFLAYAAGEGWELDDTWKAALPAEPLAAALKRSPEGMLQVLPHDAESDGFFIACLKKGK